MEIIKKDNRKLISYNDFFDESYELITPNSRLKYQLGLYDHLLNEKEVIENLDKQNDSEWFRKAENKFLLFFEELIKTEIFIEFSESIISNTEFADTINSIDYENKEEYIEFIKCYKEEETNIVKIKKISEIRLFTKFLTREIHSPTFHFENGKVNLLPNFDLFYPIFFESEKLFEKYSKTANKHDLYILKV
jgi:hypothetical protein